jgi:integrase
MWKKAEKNIYRRGEYSFLVRMMVNGMKVDETFEKLLDAQNFRDSHRVSASLDVHASAIIESRIKKRESKSFKFSDAIKNYRVKSEKKKGYKQESASLDLLSRLPIASKPLFMIHKEDILRMFDDIRSGLYRKNRIEKAAGASVKGASEATARRYANLARHIFEVAVKDWKKLESNPFEELDKADKPKDGQPRTRRLEGDEYEKLKKLLTGEARVALILLVESAMRRGELLKLEWSNLIFKGKLGTVKLIDTKNNTDRKIPLSSIAVAALKTLPRGISGKVFKLTSAKLNHEWRAARELIGSPDLRVHDMRHEATSRLFEDKGMNVIEVSSITGHKSLQMLKRYANLNPELLAKKLG